MTRLTHDDIKAICPQLAAYDDHLMSVTGRPLLGIGAAAAGIDDWEAWRHQASTIRMAVVPIRGGLGIISGFADCVCGILAHLGFDAAVTPGSDVAGFAHAVASGAQVIMAADDDRFVAFCLRQGRTVDNSRATAFGFIAGLDGMAGGLAGAEVLVLGCGPVGRWCVAALLQRRARVRVADPQHDRTTALAQWVQRRDGQSIQVITDGELALGSHDLIVDATHAAHLIRARHVTPATRIAAPGVPCGLSPRARQKLDGRFLHDPLQIGVAAMACEAARMMIDACKEDKPCP